MLLVDDVGWTTFEDEADPKNNQPQANNRDLAASSSQRRLFWILTRE